jgi:hypothetical protein
MRGKTDANYALQAMAEGIAQGATGTRWIASAGAVRAPLSAVLVALCLIACGGDHRGDKSVDATEGASHDEAGAPAQDDAAAAAEMGATLKVDDADGVGTVGDELLSLAEAIRLANGNLTVGDLSMAEKAKVVGNPGAGKADLIQVSVDNIALPAAEPNTSVVPKLIGNDRDHLDGQGVTLKEVGGMPVGTAFFAASSDLTIENFVFDNLRRGILIDPQGPVVVHDVTVRKNSFLGIHGNAVEISGSRAGSGGTLKEIAVDENKFMLPTSMTSFSYGVAIRACQLDSPDDIAPVAEGMLSNVLLDGIYVRKNSIRGGAETIVVNVASIHGKGEIKDCTLRKLIIDDNELGDSFDMLANINVAITYAFAADIASLGKPQGPLGNPGSAAVLSNIVLEDFEMARNKMEGAHTAALSLYSGIQSISKEDPNLTKIQGIVLRKVRIMDNTHVNLEGKRTICAGINVVAGHFDYVSGGLSTGNEASDIQITGNSFSGCRQGIRIAAGEVIGGGGECRDNHVSDVKILNNKLSDNDIGLQVLGAEGLPPDDIFSSVGLDFPTVGLLENNVVERVEIRGNEIRGNGVGLELIGGRSHTTASVPGDTLRNNVLKDVTLDGNTVVDNGGMDCVAANDIVVGEGSGVAEGNTAPSSCGK